MKGIIYFKDIFINVSFMSLEYLPELKDVKCNFLKYESIKQRVHEVYIHIMIGENIGANLPIALDNIALNWKGCNRIYRTIQKNLKTM